MQCAGFLLSLGGNWICPKGLDQGLGTISCQLKAKITSSYPPRCWVLRYPQSSLLPVLPRSLWEGLCSPALKDSALLLGRTLLSCCFPAQSTPHILLHTLTPALTGKSYFSSPPSPSMTESLAPAHQRPPPNVVLSGFPHLPLMFWVLFCSPWWEVNTRTAILPPLPHLLLLCPAARENPAHS